MKTILEKIHSGEFTYFEGGCGTILQAQGLKPGELPETWNILHPEIISGMHFDYILAGANIHKTNTFGASSLKYKDTEGDFVLENVIAKAVENVRIAVNAAKNGVRPDGTALTEEEKSLVSEDHYIAMDIGPLGKLLKPLGDLAFEDAVDIFKRSILAGVKAGADLVLIETINDLYEAKAAVLAAKECCNLPVFLTTAYDERHKLLTGADPKTVVAMAEGLGVDAVGTNCSLGPRELIDVVKELCKYTSVPVICCPNAGLPRSENGKTVYDIDEIQFRDAMLEIAEIGAGILGGCCGTTPAHIEGVVKALAGKTPKPVTEKNHTLITSYTHSVLFGEKPVLIGERINPTGKSKFKQALRDHNIDYILQEGLKQEARKAHVLDVNVGLPEIDEAAMMKDVVFELQSVTDLPLQIDTTNIEAMEGALRIYNGKAMINSVNGKQEVMDSVFPLVKKYGGLCVALTLDEGGIPATSEGRFAIAEKILKRAGEYGIKAKDIIFDPLAMSISADPGSADITLETIRMIKEKLGCCTSLGVSNISFGLPGREFINSAFFALAMQSGLDAAIMNPNSDEMMKAYYSFCALKNLDVNCEEFIGFAESLPKPDKNNGSGSAPAGGAGSGSVGGNGAGANGANAAGGQDPLVHAVVKGLKERAGSITGDYLKEKESLEIIDGYLIPALDIVGSGFEKKTVFLPQLLMSAEAAKASFDVIKDKIAKEGSKGTSKGTVVISTVKGDIHDIGKNIVKVLLENYGYEVIDLGKDVDPTVIVETAQKTDAALVGLSALMTTTVPAMEETIKLLRESGCRAKVCAGGAVLTQEYADMIGADKYVKDAMETVRYAEEIFMN